jgi:thioredoxin reductase
VTGSDVFDIAIIGAGPVGLAAAAQAQRRGLHFVVLERGEDIGHAVRQWGHVRVFSPWRYMIDSAARELLESEGWEAPPPDELPTGSDLLEKYLAPLSWSGRIAPSLRLGAEVCSVGRRNYDKVRTEGREAQPFEVRLRNGDALLARHVMDASGTWFSPNPMGSGGGPARGEAEAGSRIHYGIPDVLGAQRALYEGRRVLVVGSGHSALNSLIDLCALAEEAPYTEVLWALRRERDATVFGGDAADALPARGALGRRAKSAVERGAVEVLTPFRIEAVEPLGDALLVQGDLGGEPHAVMADRLIVATGFRPDLSILREVRIRLDPWLEAAEPLAPLIDPNVHSCGTVRPHGHRELAHPEPGFYIVGSKSYGRAPTFLMATGYEQARSVVAAIAGDLAAADEVHLDLPQTGVCGGVAKVRPLSGQPATENTGDAAGCCGGPAPDNPDACCVKDAEAKAAGKSGCGCSGPEPEPIVTEQGCCGGDAPAGVDACCLLDAEAKQSGKAGCGCGAAAAPPPVARASSACCG